MAPPVATTSKSFPFHQDPTTVKGRKRALSAIATTAQAPTKQFADQGDPPSQLQTDSAPTSPVQRSRSWEGRLVSLEHRVEDFSKEIMQFIKEIMQFIKRQNLPPSQEMDARAKPFHTSGTSTPADSSIETMLEETGPPFTDNIMGAQLPPKFRMPQMTPYSGFGDPTEHLEYFKVWMELNGMSSSIMCRAFSLTLSGPARKWFRQLKPKSINSFEQLSKVFITAFLGGMYKRKPAILRNTITQREDELLKDYVIRFNAEAVQVDNYSDEITLFNMIPGLKRGNFLFSIDKNPPATVADLLKRAQKYSYAEESFILRSAKRKKEDDHNQYHR